jgi:hypothetical protein
VVSATHLASVIVGAILFVVGSLLALAAAPGFFSRLGVVAIFSPNVTAALATVPSLASYLLTPLSWVFAFALTPANAPVVFVVALAMSLAGLLLLAPRVTEVVFGIIFALMALVGIVTCSVQAVDGTRLSYDALALVFIAALISVSLFALWRTRNIGSGLYYSAVRVETDPSMVNIEGADGVSWGRTGDLHSKDYPYVRHVLEFNLPKPDARNYTVKATSPGYLDISHTWAANFRWKSREEARRNEEQIKIQLKGAYEN